ncbi:MAG: winged helix DNA-binding protein [Candidatus Binatia bacterium]|nr:winged helix DNA-binding protein [Candidatus Binatia bacterium]
MATKRSRNGAPDLDQFRKHNLGWLLLQISDDFFRFVGPQLAARGHTLMRTQHATVLTLLPLEGARITDLARAAGITKQAMALTVGDLEKFGYLERAPDPSDGRAKIVRLSEAGLGMLRDAQEAVEGAWKRYAGMVGERQLRSIRKGLDELLEQIDTARAMKSGQESSGTPSRPARERRGA